MHVIVINKRSIIVHTFGNYQKNQDMTGNFLRTPNIKISQISPLGCLQTTRFETAFNHQRRRDTHWRKRWNTNKPKIQASDIAAMHYSWVRQAAMQLGAELCAA